MRSLQLKFGLAFLVTSLFGVALVAILSTWGTTRAFNQLSAEQAEAEFVERITAYYQQNMSWNGLRETLPPPPPDQPPPLSVLADQNGVVVIGNPQFVLGQRVPPSLLSSGTAIEIDGETAGTVIVTKGPPARSTPEERFLLQVNQAVIVAVGAASLLGIVISIALSRALTHPIREMRAATHRIAAGELDQQVYVSARDELGELAASFNQMSADLTHATKLRRQMTADIAHDLRTPLTVISGYLEGLRDGVLDPAPERFDVMYTEAQRLQRLVDDLRTLSLADAGELTLYRGLSAPHKLVEQAAKAFNQEARQQGITLTVEAHERLPQINVDPQRMLQVLGNLISNALRHTAEGGQVTLKAEPAAIGVRLVVQDTGEGISPEDLPYVFDRFYRADTSRHDENGESGLGLSIVKSLVDAHEGNIEVESAPEVGATFFITLPVEQP